MRTLLLFKILYQIILPLYFWIKTVQIANEVSICDWRICLTVCIAWIYGLDLCIAIYNVYLNRVGHSFEIFFMAFITFLDNQQSECSAFPAHQDFVYLNTIIFYFIFIINLLYFGSITICAILYFIILLIHIIARRPVQGILARFYPQYIRARYMENGLNQQQIEQLKIVKLTSEDLQKYDVCPICLMDYKIDDELIEVSKCKHAFHQECIKTWLQEHSICPNCRGEVI